MPLFRRVIRSSVACAFAAALTVGQGVAGAAPLNLPGPDDIVNHCSPKQVVIVPGGGNTASFVPEQAPTGGITFTVGNALAVHPDADVTYVPYKSYAFAGTPYRESSNDGYRNAARIISRIQHDCPNSSISLVGFSLGADVSARIINDAAHDRGPLDKNRFAGAVLYANPYQGGNGAVQYPPKPDVNTGALGQLNGGFGSLGSRVLEVCNPGDAVCTYPAQYRGLVEPFMRMDVLHGRAPLAEIANEVAGYGVGDYATLARGFFTHTQYSGTDRAVGIDWLNSH